MRSILVSVILSLGVAAPALADPPPPPPAAAPSVVYARRTVMDFSAMAITGDVTRPDAAYVVVPKRARFRTLIRTRGNFLPEIERSASAL